MHSHKTQIKSQIETSQQSKQGSKQLESINQKENRVFPNHTKSLNQMDYA
jgi:hypothetical protein